MNTTLEPMADGLRIIVEGRLDGSGAQHLDQEIQQAVRSGHGVIALHLEAVYYLSSAGIRSLMKAHRQMHGIGGVFRLEACGPMVREVLELAGLHMLLESAPQPTFSVLPASGSSARSSQRLIFSETVLDADAFMRGQLAGFDGNEQFTSLRVEREMIAVGIGSLGRDAGQARKNAGEFLAVAGAAVTMPTDGIGTPDDLVATEALRPELEVLDAMVARGALREFVRFEPAPDQLEPIALTELLEELRAECKGAMAFVLVAETAGLIGATLQKAPLSPGVGEMWDFPATRDWLAFTTEPACDRMLAVVAGFFDTLEASPWASALRANGVSTLGTHAHAVVFPYRPLPLGTPDLCVWIAELFGVSSAQTVMHLIADDRTTEGVGESRFWRGMAWLSPLQEEPK